MDYNWCSYAAVLLHFGVFRYSEYYSKHNISNYKLHSCVPDFSKESVFALAYAANDIVLIVLWVLASFSDARYISVVVCFIAFLANDIYGYISWQKMKVRQSRGQ